MSEGSGQRYCGTCGTEIRSGTSFCVSCGQQVEGNEERTEANASFANMGSDSRGGSSLNQRNIRLGLLGVGALLLVAIAYFVLSYSVTLGFLLIVLLALAVLVIRKNLGLQTRHEQQLFDTTNQYKESAWRAYEEGKHREIAQNAYAQFHKYKEANKRKYEEANTGYQRWNQQKADEREHNERINITYPEKENNMQHRNSHHQNGGTMYNLGAGCVMGIIFMVAVIGIIQVLALVVASIAGEEGSIINFMKVTGTIVSLGVTLYVLWKMGGFGKGLF